MTTESSTDTFEDIDPATGAVIAHVPIDGPDEVLRAVAQARAAQPAWAALTFDERAARIRRALDRLLAEAGDVGAIITREMGKPLAEATSEVARAAKAGPRVLEEVRRALEPEVYEEDATITRVEHHPLGVVAAITPWNFPVLMPLEILVPALAAGNTAVFKPSEHVPLVGVALVEAFEAELPPGVLVGLQGPGSTGAELVAADVDMIGFVGSRETGKAIMRSASGGLKRLVLELGGKDPLVVFADADLEAAADCVVLHALRNTGQVCCSVERVYVADEVSQRFEGLVLERAREWAYGNGFDDGVKMGPLVSEEQRRKVEAQVVEAVGEGARLLLGGTTPGGEGYFYPATVLSDVRDDLSISRNETFGPVITLTRFSGDEDEAVRLANDTPYGLGANVFTSDLERGRRVAGRIRSGQVGINRYLAASASAPWVGARESGFGFLGSVEGHRQFTIPKSISYPK